MGTEQNMPEPPPSAAAENLTPVEAATLAYLGQELQRAQAVLAQTQWAHRTASAWETYWGDIRARYHITDQDSVIDGRIVRAAGG